MRNRIAKLFGIMAVVALMAFAGACSKAPVAHPGGMGEGPGAFGPGGMGPSSIDDAKWRELGITTDAEKREFLEKAHAFENQDIYFDYDSYSLTPPAKKVLDEKLAFIKRYPKVKVIIEGHCDERGTTEYNLALGERRANAAFQYVMSSGAGGAKVTTISYGKERPVATGRDEASMAKNRRAHFVLHY